MRLRALYRIVAGGLLFHAPPECWRAGMIVEATFIKGENP